MPARFDHANGSVVFSRAPLYPSGDDEFLQAEDQSAGGVPFAYDPLAEEDVIVLAWQGMSKINRDNLEAFWRTVAKGMVEVFTYTDVFGTAQSVRFAEPTISFSERAYERYDVTVKLLKI